MKTISNLLFTALFVGSIFYTQAQTLTLEQIYGHGMGPLSTKGMETIKWLPDGNAYLTLERNATVFGLDMVQYDAKTGDREVLVPAEKFIPKGRKKRSTLSVIPGARMIANC